MDAKQVDQLIALYGEKFPIVNINQIKEKLINMDFNTATVYLSQMKDPTLTIIMSVIAGSLGVDRFYLGDIGLGVVKLLTCGGAGIWWLIDLFLIMDRARQLNLEKMLNIY